MGKNYFFTLFLLIVLIISSGWLFLPSYIDSRIKATVAGISTQASALPGLISPAPSANGSDDQILFVSNVSGNYEIYSFNLSTRKMINLSNNSADDMNPQMSPDGKSIVFYSNRSGNNQIYRMDTKGNNVVSLTENNFQDFDPSYSPDGTKIVFKSTRDDKLGDIFIMNDDGTEQKNLTVNRKTTEEWDPTFSKDGSRVYFVVRKGTNDQTDDLYMMNTDGGELKQLTNNTLVDWYPSVNPKNGKILFVSREVGGSTDDLYEMDENGTNRQRIISLIGNDADPAWSMDGERIVFIRENETNYDLYLMNADGSNLTKIMATDKDELSPIFMTPEK